MMNIMITIDLLVMQVFLSRKKGLLNMLLYRNGHDDYGKREMTLRRTLRHIKDELFESISKEDLMNTLLLIRTGDLDCDIIPSQELALDYSVEYTGNDPVHAVVDILELFPRQVLIMVQLFRQRCCQNLGHESYTVIYHYLLNKKIMMMDMPYTLNLQDIDLILNSQVIEFEIDDDGDE